MAESIPSEKASTLTASIIEQRCVHEGVPLLVSEALASKSLRALLTSAQQESGTDALCCSWHCCRRGEAAAARDCQRPEVSVEAVARLASGR